MTTVVSALEVRPVGQGAFIRGRVATFEQGPRTKSLKQVRWVYDCGTDSRQCFIDKSVHELSFARDEGPLDILIISHFDKDHISGLPTLLSVYKFRRVMMPHLPRLMRLTTVLRGIEEVEPGRFAELLKFADDPVGYIRERGGEDTEIVLVDPAAGPDSDAPAPGDDGREPGQLPELPPESVGEQTDPATYTPGTIRTIASGAPLRLSPAWELVPYVDSDVRELLLEFDSVTDFSLLRQLARIRRAANKLLAATSQGKARTGDGAGRAKRKGVDASVKVLKNILKNARQAIYVAIEKKLGSGINDKHKNAISLMAYMGPCMQPPCTCVHACVLVGVGANRPAQNYMGCYADRAAWLLTGDADLKKNDNVDRLVKYMTARRIESLAVFQVPHHGSRNNSSAYTQSQLTAPFNVINANPHSRHEHPDQDVVDLFPHAMLANDHAFEVVSMATNDAAFLSPHLLWRAFGTLWWHW